MFSLIREYDGQSGVYVIFMVVSVRNLEIGVWKLGVWSGVGMGFWFTVSELCGFSEVEDLGGVWVFEFYL